MIRLKIKPDKSQMSRISIRQDAINKQQITQSEYKHQLY